MRNYDSNQQLYDHIDQTIASLKNEGHIKLANQIHNLLHEVAWTTSSELFGGLRVLFEQALNSPTPLPSSIASDLQGFVATINQAWERANSAV